MESTVFYDSLRALGPVTASDVPDVLAMQIAATGAAGNDNAQIKATIALYSRAAATSSREEFAKVLSTGVLPTNLRLADEKQTVEKASKSCCGHTCEGGCTPGSTR